MTPTHLLLRLARHVLDAGSRRQRGRVGAADGCLDRLAGRCLALQRLHDRLHKARTHGLDHAADKAREELHGWLRLVREALEDVEHARAPAQLLHPCVADLVQELRQAEGEFSGLTIDWQEKYVGVVTEPITLEEVHLGPFAVRLYWGRLAHAADSGCFEVVALEPNPAEGASQVTHPHVRSNRLCAGDASGALRRALEQGRLADAFQLVRGVLRLYNPASPHVRLEEWGGRTCRDCDRRIHDEDVYYCAACGDDYCESCAGSCPGCSDTRCLGCLVECAVCHEAFCGRCLRPSAHSSRRCCGNCLTRCPACAAEVAKDEVIGRPAWCPTCDRRRRGASTGTADPATSNSANTASTPEEPHAPTPHPVPGAA
jgi:hypothetical protein